ncbi:MAG: ATP-binding cassette domain-containing protein [Proteobacteria bacterium]|nr:ATP-binding cassette domain-containing protein [Pseudomonadota bacterium]
MQKKDLKKLIKPTAWRRTDVLSASVSMNLLGLCMPIVILQIYDRILPNQSYDTLAVFIIVLCGVAVLDALLEYSRTLIMVKSSAFYEYRVNTESMNSILKSDLSAFDSKSHGHYLESFQGIEAIREFYHGSSMFLVVELPFVLLFLALIWQFSGSMVLIPLCMIIIFFVISYLAGQYLRDTIEVKNDHHERRQNFVIECLQGMHVIKSMAMESQMLRRYERLQANSANSIYDLAQINTIVHGLASTFSQAVMVSYVAIGSIFVVNNELSIGALAAGTMLSGRVLQPALRALSFWTYRQSVKDKEDKLEKMISIKQEAVDENATDMVLKGKIELQNITFKYDDSSKTLLKDISLVVQPGESVSIRGANGSGKSTLLNIIMGFVNLDKGKVLLDDIDIRKLNHSRIRSQIGLIPQQGVLFNGTLLENMTLYREGQPVSDAMKLAGKLYLDGTILRLPNGLDTMANSDLSQAIPQGFAQRLVTVRALVGNPSVILFDDANPGFDDRNDKYLQNLLMELREHHTLIIVSHRPSLQKICDRHYEIKDGRLVTTSGAFLSKKHNLLKPSKDQDPAPVLEATG